MPLYTVEEFADEYGFTKAQLKTHIADGMPAESINGGPRVIPEEEALEWLEDRGLVEDADEDDDLDGGEDDADLDDDQEDDDE